MKYQQTHCSTTLWVPSKITVSLHLNLPCSLLFLWSLGQGLCVLNLLQPSLLCHESSKTQITWIEFTAKTWRNGTKDTLLMPWKFTEVVIQLLGWQRTVRRGRIQIKCVEKMNCIIKCCSYAVLRQNRVSTVLYQQWRRKSYRSTCTQTYIYIYTFTCLHMFV